MLYDNDSYDVVLQKWANASGVFYFFVAIAIKIIEGIQFILRQLYAIVNKSYMSLSREMEFHADEIAAHVTGYEPLQSGLLRLSFADHSLGTIYQFYQSKMSDNQVSKNLFKDQSYVLNFLANDRDLPMENNLPVINLNDENRYNKSKLVIKDQWASHPSTEERLKRLESTNLNALEIDFSPANDFFADIEKTQKKITEKLFRNIEYKGEVNEISDADFQQSFKEEFNKNTFPKIYNSYFDQKNPTPFDFKTLSKNSDPLSLQDLFSNEKVDWVYESIALENDIEDLKKISQKTYGIKTFDYDGLKYKRNQSQNLIPKLKEELVQLEKLILKNDMAVFAFFQDIESSKSNNKKLSTYYEDLFSFGTRYEELSENCLHLSDQLHFTATTFPVDVILDKLDQVRKEEVHFKNEIKELISNEILENEISSEMEENFNLYLSKNWKYFNYDKYIEKNLEIFMTALSDYASLLSRAYFLYKKRHLDYQEKLLIQ